LHQKEKCHNLENIRLTNLPPAIIAVMATAALTAAIPRASAIA